jgi:hypothetical protein
MGFRRAARKDDNHQVIVKAFRGLGWSVLDTAQLKNCVDLVVAKDGYTVMVEVKDGAKPPSARKLTVGELKFKQSWNGPYFLVLSVDDVELLNSIAGKVSID